MATITQKRRTVHFQSLQDILNDAEAHATLDAITIGKWSKGQIFEHLARVMEKSIDGYELKARWYIRLAGRLLKKRFLTKPMKPGLKLPKNAEQELVAEEVSTEEGLEHLRTAIHRLQTEPHRAPSPVFGEMTLEEWNQLHCRHSELHLSFISDP